MNECGTINQSKNGESPHHQPQFWELSYLAYLVANTLYNHFTKKATSKIKSMGQNRGFLQNNGESLFVYKAKELTWNL